MRRLQNILAVYNECEGSEAVLDQAVPLARTNGARLTLVNPIGENPQSAGAVEEARKRMSRVVPWIGQEGVPNTATAVLVGTPYLEIVRQVQREDHDLVIISAETNRVLKDFVFGSTAANLMRKCPCAVWVLKSERTVSCARILAAVGRRADDAPCDALNAEILALAMALSVSHKATLHVVHAWVPEGNDAEMLTSEISDETREAILRKIEVMNRNAINALLARNPVVGLEHEIHLPRGLPLQSIVASAERLGADVIVMGSAGRVGVPRFFMGNPTETVFGAVHCSVLAVTPESVRRPVSLPQDDSTPGLRRLAGTRH